MTIFGTFLPSNKNLYDGGLCQEPTILEYREGSPESCGWIIDDPKVVEGCLRTAGILVLEAHRSWTGVP